MRIRMLLRTAPLLVGIALLPACDRAEDADIDTEEGLEPLPAEETPPVTPDEGLGMGAERSAQFEPGPAGADVSGTLRILESGTEGSQFTVELNGLSAGEHAWHVHNAPCGQEGPIVVPFTEIETEPGIAEPLRVGEDGRATATVTVPSDRLSQEQLRSGQYSLHVHERGGVDHGETVACVNIQ